MASSENENDAAQVYLLGKTYLANNQGQFYIRNDPIAYMAAGDRHTIIITESGRAFAFGDNSSGQLGLGHTNNVEKVSCIKSLKFSDTGEKVVLAACGREASLVATNHGSMYGFGSNSRAQLGSEPSDSKLNHTVPVKIQFRGTFNWKQIAMGAEHACALNDEGTVYIWGANDEGQCGQIKKTDIVTTPRELRMPNPIVYISCGYYHTAMVDDQGHLYVVGSNDDRQLGRTITDKFSGPQQVSIPNKVVAVACGHQHTIVLTDKGQVYASGLGDRGQLGFGQRVFSSEHFEPIPGLPKNVTAIAAGEAHTAVIGNRHDLYVFGDGKHGKLGSVTTHTNEFEPCRVEKLKNFNVLKVVCGGCQTIVLAQKKTSESKKSSGSEEDIGNATLSITQRPKSLARSMRNKNLTDRSTTVGDSLDSTMQHARPLGKPNNLRVEPDDEKSENELSESMKSATFNQTHTITNGKFRPTQSPTINRSSLRSNDEDGLKTLKTGVLDRTARLNKNADDLGKTNNRLPSLEKVPARGTRFDRSSPKRQDSDDEDKSSSDEQRPPFRKKPEPPVPERNERKRPSPSPSPPPVRKPSPIARRRNDSDSDNDKPKRPSPVKTSQSETLNRKARPQKQSDDDDEEDEEEEEEEEPPRKSSRQTKPPPPTVARRGSLPQTRSGMTTSLPRDGNQTIGSRPVDGVRGSFRTTATKTLAKPAASNQSIDSTKKETPPASEPGFFRRLFGAKPTPPPTPAPEKKATPPATTTTTPAAANANSRTCSIM